MDFHSLHAVVSLLSLYSLRSAVCLFALLLSNRGKPTGAASKKGVCLCSEGKHEERQVRNNERKKSSGRPREVKRLEK